MSQPLTFQLVRGIAHWHRPSTWTSPIIGFFGDGFYSHVDVLTPEGKLRGARSDVIGGISAGVEDRPQNYERWAKCTRFTIHVANGKHRNFWKYSDEQMHKPYDAHGLLDTFVLGRQWKDDDMWWCSELQAMSGEKSSIWRIPDNMLGVTPGDLVFLLVGAKAKIEEMPT